MWRGGRFVRRTRGLSARGFRLVRLLPRALRRFVELPADERWTTVRALSILLRVELVIRWSRLPRLARQLGVALAPGAAPNLAGASPEVLAPAPASTLPREVVRARRCVGRVMAVWPLGAGPCLRESLTLGALIRQYDPVLRLGVARRGRRIRAHAWIEIDDLPVNDPLGFVAFRQEAEAVS
jgi:hypothetical protein